MEKVKLLKVVFNQEIRTHEIPAFRGAIIDKTKKDNNLLFHNHFGDEQFRYAYPLIQYKTIRKKASLVCMGAGVDEIHKFFNQPNWTIRISERTLPLEIDELSLKQHTFQVWDKFFNYRINNWIALNSESYKIYQSLKAPTDQKEMLQKKLIGNIISMAKGLGWEVDKTIECEILDIDGENWVKVKNVHLKAFRLRFKTNVFIPNHIGLGKSSSLGFGKITALKPANSLTAKEEEN